MNLDLGGRTAPVTGSIQGIGHAILTRLAEVGARVAVNGRGEGRIEDAVERLRADIASVTTGGAPGGGRWLHRFDPAVARFRGGRQAVRHDRLDSCSPRSERSGLVHIV